MASSIHILLVDDNKKFRETLKEVLELKHYKVDLAEDGYQALDAVDKRRYDLVLMDIKMPGIDGVETYRRMRGKTPEARVIMVSAYCQDGLEEEVLSQGVRGVIQKPLDFELLFKTIESNLDPHILDNGLN